MKYDECYFCCWYSGLFGNYGIECDHCTESVYGYEPSEYKPIKDLYGSGAYYTR